MEVPFVFCDDLMIPHCFFYMQVLTFPVLMEDDAIANEFQKLIEAVDDVHELALAKQQHFPVFSILF